MVTQEDRLKAAREILTTVAWMRRSGFDATTTSRIARETIHFVLERADMPQWDFRRPHSSAARLARGSHRGASVPSGIVTYDHPVPLTTMWQVLLDLAADSPAFAQHVGRWIRPVIITRSENEALRRAGLQSSMPSNWDGADILARYKAIGIAFEEQDVALMLA